MSAIDILGVTHETEKPGTLIDDPIVKEIGIYAAGVKYLFEKRGNVIRIFLNDQLLIQQEMLIGKVNITINASFLHTQAKQGQIKYT